MFSLFSYVSNFCEKLRCLNFFIIIGKMATKRAASDDTSAHSSGDSKFDKYSDILKQQKID